MLKQINPKVTFLHCCQIQTRQIHAFCQGNAVPARHPHSNGSTKSNYYPFPFKTRRCSENNDNSDKNPTKQKLQLGKIRSNSQLPVPGQLLAQRLSEQHPCPRHHRTALGGLTAHVLPQPSAALLLARRKQNNLSSSSGRGMWRTRVSAGGGMQVRPLPAPSSSSSPFAAGFVVLPHNK